MADEASIYLLSFSFETPGIYCVESITKGFNEYQFYEGKQIDAWPEDILFIVDGWPKEEFLLCDLHYRLVSENVRRVFIEKDVQGVQFLPVRVVHRQTQKDLGLYWALNVIQTVEKLRWNFIQGIPLFRWGITSIYISHSLKDYLEEAGLTSGAGFVSVPHRTLNREDSAN